MEDKERPIELVHTGRREADVVRVSGEIDLDSAAELEDFLAEHGRRDLVIDLRGVTFMDSSGLHILLKTQEQMREKKAALRLIVGSQDPVYHLFELAGLIDVFEIADED